MELCFPITSPFPRSTSPWLGPSRRKVRARERQSEGLGARCKRGTVGRIALSISSEGTAASQTELVSIVGLASGAGRTQRIRQRPGDDRGRGSEFLPLLYDGSARDELSENLRRGAVRHRDQLHVRSCDRNEHVCRQRGLYECDVVMRGKARGRKSEIRDQISA